MESRNIGPWKAWLAMGMITFALSGCGAPEDGVPADGTPAPEEKTASIIIEPEDIASTGGLGKAVGGFGHSVAITSGGGPGGGFGAGPRMESIVSSNHHSVMANDKGVVQPKRATARAIIIEPPSVEDPGDEFASLLAEIDRKLASLPSANIAFNTPETIPFGDSAVIELLVSLEEAEEELRQAIRAVGPVETAKVKVSPYLEASLAGVGFSIEPITPPRQLLSPTQRTQWRWNIEPTKAASLELTLTLSALFTVDGQQSTRAIQTFERTITVDVPITHRVTDLVTANKELLVTLLLIPSAGWFYRRYRSGKTPSDDNQGDPPALSRAA